MRRVLLFIPLLLAGCASPAATPADAVEPASASDALPWTVGNETAIEFLLAAGGVAASATQGSCREVSFEVPEGATRLAVAATTQAVDPGRPGFGVAGLSVRHDSSQDDVLMGPEGRAEHVVEDPAPGAWSAVVVGLGLNVNQRYVLRVDLEGAGPAPPEGLALEEVC